MTRRVRADPARPTPMRPFSRSLPMQLMRAREAVMQRFRPHLRERGLTEQQWRVIRALAETDEIDIFTLSARCCILQASLSRILPKLEELGLVTRRAHKHDLRRVVISIAPQGRRLYETVAPQSEEIYSGIERDLGPERMRELYRVLDQMIEVLAPADQRREATAEDN